VASKIIFRAHFFIFYFCSIILLLCVYIQLNVRICNVIFVEIIICIIVNKYVFKIKKQFYFACTRNFFWAECMFNQKSRENLVIYRVRCDTGDLQVFLCNIFEGNCLNQECIQCVL